VRKNIKNVKRNGRRIAGLSVSVERRIKTAGRTWQRRDYRLAAPHPDSQRSSARSAAAAAAAVASSSPPLSIRYRSPSTSPTAYSSRTHTLTQTSTTHRRCSFRIISARWYCWCLIFVRRNFRGPPLVNYWVTVDRLPTQSFLNFFFRVFAQFPSTATTTTPIQSSCPTCPRKRWRKRSPVIIMHHHYSSVLRSATIFYSIVCRSGFSANTIHVGFRLKPRDRPGLPLMVDGGAARLNRPIRWLSRARASVFVFGHFFTGRPSYCPFLVRLQRYYRQSRMRRAAGSRSDNVPMASPVF